MFESNFGPMETHFRSFHNCHYLRQKNAKLLLETLRKKFNRKIKTNFTNDRVKKYKGKGVIKVFKVI